MAVKKKKSSAKKTKAIPTNPRLYAQVKAEAKRKFDIFPSAYSSGYIVRMYKKKGGKYRTGKA